MSDLDFIPIRYPDCEACKGSGVFMGGDEYRQCPTCRLRKGRANEIEISRLIPSEYGDTWDQVLAHIGDGCCGDYFVSANAEIEADLCAGKEIVEPIEIMTIRDQYNEDERMYLVLDGHHRTALSYEYGRTTIPFVNVDEIYADEIDEEN